MVQSGIHHKGMSCDPKESVNTIEMAYTSKKDEFFPDQIELESVNTGIKRAKVSNGGWSDPRDHQLCKSFFFFSQLNNDVFQYKNEDVLHV